jgi:hypothetical protein
MYFFNVASNTGTSHEREQNYNVNGDKKLIVHKIMATMSCLDIRAVASVYGLLEIYKYLYNQLSGISNFILWHVATRRSRIYRKVYTLFLKKERKKTTRKY